jgi:hypothetical protein
VSVCILEGTFRVFGAPFGLNIWIVFKVLSSWELFPGPSRKEGIGT